MILNNLKMVPVALVTAMFFMSATALAEGESCRTVRFCLIDLPIIGIGCIRSGCENKEPTEPKGPKEPKEPTEPKERREKPDHPGRGDFFSVPNKI